MGRNNLEYCYNKGRISILEEGVEDTYALPEGHFFGLIQLRGVCP